MVSRCKLKLQKRALSCLSVPNTTVPIKNIYYFQNTSNLACKGKVSIIIPFVRNAMAWQALLRNEILAEDFLYLSRVYYLLNPDYARTKERNLLPLWGQESTKCQWRCQRLVQENLPISGQAVLANSGANG